MVGLCIKHLKFYLGVPWGAGCRSIGRYITCTIGFLFMLICCMNFDEVFRENVSIRPKFDGIKVLFDNVDVLQMHVSKLYR